MFEFNRSSTGLNGFRLAHTMSQTEIATFGGGCFWCIEAVFQRLPGVRSVRPGYAGGTVPNPTYEQVCMGATGHAEVAQIVFDPTIVAYDALLDLFWKAHDPTTLNRQGGDVGTQYRSVIFAHTDRQRLAAERSRDAVQKGFESPLVTEILPLDVFYEAEDYHRGYYQNHPSVPYCMFVIQPKLKNLGME